jgi:hypothetical protein
LQELQESYVHTGAIRVSLQLAERGLRLFNDLWVREVRNTKLNARRDRVNSFCLLDFLASWPLGSA